MDFDSLRYAEVYGKVLVVEVKGYIKKAKKFKISAKAQNGILVLLTVFNLLLM